MSHTTRSKSAGPKRSSIYKEDVAILPSPPGVVIGSPKKKSKAAMARPLPLNPGVKVLELTVELSECREELTGAEVKIRKLEKEVKRLGKFELKFKEAKLSIEHHKGLAKAVKTQHTADLAKKDLDKEKELVALQAKVRGKADIVLSLQDSSNVLKGQIKELKNKVKHLKSLLRKEETFEKTQKQKERMFSSR